MTSTPLGIDWDRLEADWGTATWTVSPYCLATSPDGHARCAHPANRSSTDGCRCWCHQRRDVR